MMKKLLGLWLLAVTVYGAPVELIEQNVLTGVVQKRVIEDKNTLPALSMDPVLVQSAAELAKFDIRIIRVADRIQFVILTSSIFDHYSPKMTKNGLTAAKAIRNIVKQGAQSVKVSSLASTKIDSKRVDRQAKALMSAIGAMGSPVTYFSDDKVLDKALFLPFWEEETGFGFQLDSSPYSIIVIQVQLSTGQKPWINE